MDFLDWISVLSFMIGLMNLELNEKQVDNLEKHLSEQDERILKTIIDQNNKILEKLEKL